MIKLGDICETTQGIQISKSEQKDRQITGYIRYLYISDFFSNSNLKFVEDKYPDKVVTEHDLVMANTGSPGKVFKGVKGVLSNNLFKISFDNSVVFVDYLYYILSSSIFQQKLQTQMKQGIQQHLGHQTIKRQMIPLPPLPEQKRIAAILDKADAVRRKRQETIRLLDEFLRSVFLEMFGDPVRNEKGWKIRRLEELADIERGRFSPRPRNDPSYYEGKYPFIQTGDISNCNYRLKSWKQTLNEKGIKVSKCFKKGTIVIAIVGATIGATAVLEIDAYAPDSVVGINVNSLKATTEYIEYVLRFWKPIFLERAPETARANINLETLKPLQIPLPSIELQHKFIHIVNKTEQQRQLFEKSLAETENSFNSLMQKAFRGEL